MNQQRALLVYPPAIPFKKEPSKKNTELGDAKDNFKTIEIDLDPSNANSTDKTEWKVEVFEEGTTEEWVCWRIQFEELVTAYPLDTSTKKILFARTLL